MNKGPYFQKISRRQWWLGAPRYRRYMLRELTSLFIGAYAIALLVGLWRHSQGVVAFAGWVEAMHSPVGQSLNVLALLAAVYHSSTWFNVTPKAMSLWIAGRKLPDEIVVAAHYAGWLLVSVFIFVLMRV